ncbi:MAG: efflux RND transporter periplasmic adaptor subunit [Planctomycetaceae bacterium]
MTNVWRFLLGLAAIAAAWFAWRTVYLDSVALMSAPPPARPVDLLAVEVLPVKNHPIADRIDLIGSLEPLKEVELRSRVSGYIVALPYDLGDEVPAGVAAISLDESDQFELIQQAEAALKVAEAELAAQQSQRQQAQRQLVRYQELAREGATTSQQLEEAQALVEVADANAALQRALVEQKQSEVSRVKLGLQDLHIKSPIAGTVAMRYASLGDLAKPDTPLLRLVNLDRVQTVVHVIERDYERVRQGQKATMTVDAWPGVEFSGEVSRVAPVVDPTTRTAAVHVEFNNLERHLKPGMHARVAVHFREARSVQVVPIAALLEVDDVKSVFVISDQSKKSLAERREVRTGINNGELVEILSGLSPGEKVITLGSRLVKHGQEVNVIEATWPVTLAHTDGPTETP